MVALCRAQSGAGRPGIGDEAAAGDTSGEPPRATTAFRKTAGALGGNVRGPAGRDGARFPDRGVYDESDRRLFRRPRLNRQPGRALV